MMTLAQPWGLLALATVPALIALHFYRQRFQPRDVAGLFLWPSGETLPPSGRTRRRLETPFSLLLEILAALLLAALISGAGWEDRVSRPHVIAILDHSASMAAVDGAGERTADRAIGAIRRACEERGPLSDVRLSVILSGPRPTTAAGPAARSDLGLAALQAWKPDRPGHSFAPALEMAGRLAEAGGTVMLVTDRPDRAADEVGRGIRIAGVGRALPNAAITSAERSLDRAGGGTAVSIRVSNFSGAAVVRDVALLDESQGVLARASLGIPAGGDASAAWAAPGTGLLTVRLEGTDSLAADDRIFLAPPRPRNVLVRSEFPPNSATYSRIERACRAITHVAWMEPSDPGEPHLVIGPTHSRDGWSLSIGPPEEALRAGAMLDPLVGPYLADASHPLMEQLDFRGVIWSGAFMLKPDVPVMPLLSAADVPLLFQLRSSAPRFFINVDPERSNLHKSPAWPMFFHNLTRFRREALPGLKRWNFRPGETVSWRLPETAGEEVRIFDPDGKELPVARLRDSVELAETWKPGIYTVREAGRAEPADRFSVLFLDPEESDLRGASETAPTRPDPGTSGGVKETARRAWVDPALGFLILALALTDLAWLRRRGRA